MYRNCLIQVFFSMECPSLWLLFFFLQKCLRSLRVCLPYREFWVSYDPSRHGRQEPMSSSVLHHGWEHFGDIFSAAPNAFWWLLSLLTCACSSLWFCSWTEVTLISIAKKVLIYLCLFLWTPATLQERLDWPIEGIQTWKTVSSFEQSGARQAQDAWDTLIHGQ